MGYYTLYSVRMLCKVLPEDDLSRLIAADEAASGALDASGDSKGWAKWYEHEAAVCGWSELYPETMFFLHAEGEDSDGIWNKYFWGGRLLHTQAFTGLTAIEPGALTAPNRGRP